MTAVAGKASRLVQPVLMNDWMVRYAPIRKQIGERIRQARDERNLAQRSLAEKLGVTQSSISLWERGENLPEYHMVVNLANVLGVSAQWLMEPLFGPIPQEIRDRDEIIKRLLEEMQLLRSTLEEPGDVPPER